MGRPIGVGVNGTVWGGGRVVMAGPVHIVLIGRVLLVMLKEVV